MGGDPVLGERIGLPVSHDGISANAVLGASDFEHRSVSGPVELVIENMEWFAI